MPVGSYTVGMDFHDPFASASHLAFAAFLLFAGAVLSKLTRWHDPHRRWAVWLFSLSAVLLYLASGLFHGVRHPSEASAELFRRFDLSGIFLLIAGSYLPVFAYLLVGRWRVVMAAVVLMLAGAGMTAVWLLDAPQPGTMVPVYAAQAVVGLVPLLKYVRAAGVRVVGWMLAAAGVYALGGMCEVFKWPTPIPGLIGPHEVLHITDLLGTLLHLSLVVWLVRRTFPMPTESNR
jgi:hemolysin III